MEHNKENMESEDYEDAELRISKNANTRPSVQRKSSTNGETVPWDQELRISDRKYLSTDKCETKKESYQISGNQLKKLWRKKSIIEARKQLRLKKLKWRKATAKSTAQNAGSQSISSRKQAATIRDKQSVESAQVEETATANDRAKTAEGSSNFNAQVNDEQEPSLVIDVDENQSQQEQPRENYGSHNHLASNLKAAPKLPAPIKQTLLPNQHNNQRFRVLDIQTLLPQEPRVNDTLNGKQITSQLTPSSLSPELCNYFEKVRRNMTAQNSSNQIDLTQPLPKPSTQPSPAIIQNPVPRGSSILIANGVNSAPVAGITNSFQGIQHVTGINPVSATDTRVVNAIQSFTATQYLRQLHQNVVYQGVQQNLPRPQEYTQMAIQDLPQNPTPQRLDHSLENRLMSELPLYQPTKPCNISPTHLPSQFHQPLEIQLQAQTAVNQRDAPLSQHPVDILILTKNNRATLQDAKKRTLPTLSKVPESVQQGTLTEQEFQAILNRANKTDLTNVLRNIAVLQADYLHRSKMTTGSSDPQRMEASTSSQNVRQHPHSQVTQSNEANPLTKHVHFEYDTVRSATKQTRVVDRGYPTGMHAPLSPPNSVASDSEIEVEKASSYEMSGAAHEAANVTDQTEHNSAGRSTAQNPQSKFDLMLKVVELLETLNGQVNSNLQIAANFYDHLRNSHLQTAKLFQEMISKPQNSASNAPASSVAQEIPPVFNQGQNLAPLRENSQNSASDASSTSAAQEIPPVFNQGQNSAPLRQNSSNGNDQSNAVSTDPEITHQRTSEEHPYSTQSLLPREYDPNDTKWTLNFRNYMPGLFELIPNSNIYVRFSVLQRCEQESTSCQSLAQMMLHEVFNVNALSVCASVIEMSNLGYMKSPGARPPLDDQGLLALLKYVVEYGVQVGWNIHVGEILQTLHHEVKRMRFKYGVRI